MGSILETWGDALIKLVDPYRETAEALWALAVGAQIGTLIVGATLLMVCLELLRASKGWVKHIWRLASIGSATFLVAAIVYGDFLAGPAKAAYSLIAERAGSVPPEAAAWTTMSVASVGVLAYVGRRAALNARAGEEPRWRTRAYASSRTSRVRGDLGELGRLVALDPAGRLQLRLFTRNAKKDVQTIKPMRGVRRA
jgi:hypothetical protein